MSEQKINTGSAIRSNFSGTENETDEWEEFPSWQPPEIDVPTAAVASLYMSMFMIAVAGNSLVIATIVQQSHMRTVTNTMLLNLALVDLLLVFICMPVTLCGFILKNFIFPAVMCPVAFFLQGLAFYCSFINNFH